MRGRKRTRVSCLLMRRLTTSALAVIPRQRKAPFCATLRALETCKGLILSLGGVGLCAALAARTPVAHSCAAPEA
jgi:hypothetical protein